MKRKRHSAAEAVKLNDLESLKETLVVLSDPELMEQIRESEAELERGEDGATLENLRADLDGRSEKRERGADRVT